MFHIFCGLLHNCESFLANFYNRVVKHVVIHGKAKNF